MVDVRVGVGRYLSPTAVHFQTDFQTSKIASREIVCGKSCVEKVYTFAKSASHFAHVHFLLVTQCRYAFVVEIQSCMISTTVENTMTDAAQCRYAFVVETQSGMIST
jgi:hypothetical protein